jgi:hypothetical protein
MSRVSPFARPVAPLLSLLLQQRYRRECVAADRKQTAVLGNALIAGEAHALTSSTAAVGAVEMFFGAPTFLAGEELFWGNDRLEQAIAWARRGADHTERGP